MTPSHIAKKLKVTYEQVKDILQGPPGHPQGTLEDYFTEVKRRQEFAKANRLRTRLQVMHQFTDKKPIAISFFSDIHLGSGGVDYDALYADTKTVHETDGMYCVFNGDEINNFIIGRLQACSRHDSFQPDDQWIFFRLLVQRLAPKTLAAVRGNHTDWSQMLSDVDIRGEMMAQLNVLDIGHGGRVDIDVAGAEYTVYLRHKARFESSLNMYNAVVRMYEFQGPFDIGVIGHTHTAGISTQERQGRHFTAIRPGSYKVHDEYAEEWGFTGCRCISPTVILMPETKRIINFENAQEAAEYLAFLRSKR
jgi:predicted phosphodiesterase